MQLAETQRNKLNTTLAGYGLRMTRQREFVFAVLNAQRDHPTADDVFVRAKKEMPSISLATVYNCLETLVECDLVKKLNYEREPSRFCPNDGEHAHFLDETTGRVYDISVPTHFLNTLKMVLPPGFEAKKFKLSFSGYAPDPDHIASEKMDES